MARKLVFASWDDVPHLTPAMREAQLATMDPHLQDARTRGIPFLGAGAVYPVALSDFEIRPIPLQDHWVRGFAMDVGWNKTAALWGALDRESDVLYVYDEHYVGQEAPSVHANAIMGYNCNDNRRRGKWIPGVIDPNSKGRAQKDGVQLMSDYQSLGLDLDTALNAVDAGVHEVWLRLSSGRLKVFKTLQYFFTEYLLYRRDENGKIIQSKKRPDHLMDCLRYLVVSGIARMRAVPFEKDRVTEYPDIALSGQGWMAG